MSLSSRHRHFGIVTQVFPPDPAAVGQHLADVAEELVKRGHRVTVLTSDRAYDDPSLRFPRFERNGGIEVLRLPWSSFGKQSIGARLASGLSLLAQATVLATLDLRLSDLLLSTTPHACGALGVALRRIRGLPFHYWLMDLNPDQIVSIGKLRPDALAVRGFDWLNRLILSHATSITTLDHEMAARFGAKGTARAPLAVQPPWAVQESLGSVDASASRFRSAHGVESRRIVMHAGNHSAVHPLDTLLEAIARKAPSEMRYFFVGGGVGKVAVEDWANHQSRPDVKLLPYQPREQVRDMLAAADVHVVSVGNGTVGMVHPSKLYGALTAARPVLVLGPECSPAARVVQDFGVGWRVEHGDVDGAERALDEIERLSAVALRDLKQRAREAAERRFSREVGVREFCDRLLSS